MEIDPVCGMKIYPATAKYKYLYRGKIYYFCCRKCYEKFIENPNYYLDHGPTGSMD